MRTRIPLVVLLALSVFWGPFWLSVILMLVGIVIFDHFFEGPAMMLLVDLLYGVPLDRFNDYPFVALSLGLILLFLVEYIKRKSRFKKFNEK